MTTNKFQLGKHILKYGVIFGCIWILRHIIVYSIYNKLGPLDLLPTLADIIIFISGITIGTYTYKKKNFGYLKYFDGLKIGNGINFIVYIFLHFSTVFYKVYHPNYMDRITTKQREETIVNNPMVSPEEIKENLPNTFISIDDVENFLIQMILGLMVTIVVTAILYKRKKI